MGCCISRPAGPNSPYPGGVTTTGSARAINDLSSSTSTGPGAAPATQDAAQSAPAGERRSWRRTSQPLSQHINKPLRRHAWTSRGRIWTRAALERERADFFDTRVTGRPEVWQTLRAALDVLWTADAAAGGGADTDDEGGVVALATAQSILAAADITLPTGDLAQGAYDALGNFYSIPEHVVADPANLDDEAEGGGAADGEDTGGEGGAEDGYDDDDDDEVARRREEKGKAVLDVSDQLMLRARLSEGSHDVVLAIGKGDWVRSIARSIAEEADIPSNKKIRIAYMGKILKEGVPLTSQGWKPGHVVNALVFNR